MRTHTRPLSLSLSLSLSLTHTPTSLILTLSQKVERAFIADMIRMQECFLLPIAEMKNAKQDILRDLAVQFASLKSDIQVGVLGSWEWEACAC